MTTFRDLTLYVIRHGECEHNVDGRIAGQNNSPLTLLGREQASANGKLLKEVAGDLAKFDFHASSLHRACATMELVRQAAGLTPIGYLADRRLMESDFGAHTWMLREDAHRAAGPDYAHDRWNYVRPGGESLAMIHARIGAFLAELKHDSVIVTHAGPVLMLRCHMLGLSPGETMRYEAPHAGIMRLSKGTEAYFGN